MRRLSFSILESINEFISQTKMKRRFIPFVAASLGPSGHLLKPLGPISFDEAYEGFTLQVKAALDGGADLIFLETMTDTLIPLSFTLACVLPRRSTYCVNCDTEYFYTQSWALSLNSRQVRNERKTIRKFPEPRRFARSSGGRLHRHDRQLVRIRTGESLFHGHKLRHLRRCHQDICRQAAQKASGIAPQSRPACSGKDFRPSAGLHKLFPSGIRVKHKRSSSTGPLHVLQKM